MNRKLSVTLVAAVAGSVMAAAIAFQSPDAPAVSLPPAASEMAALTVASLRADVVPARVSAEMERLPDPAFNGAAVPGQAQLLASNVGRYGSSMHAFPTTRGAVCLVIAERTTLGTCVPQFDVRRGNVSWMIYSGPDRVQTVAGLASDAVSRVDIVVNGAAVPATVANNTFHWQADDASVAREDITAIVSHQRDGNAISVNVDFD